jgi:phospholipid transport system substrate-binding protein
MKKFLTACLLFLSAVSTAAAQTADAESFAKKIADDIMKEIVLSEQPVAKKQAAFRRIFTENADVDRVARFTLGRYAKTASAEDVALFREKFLDSVIKTWTARFDNYSGEKIIFKDSRKNDKKDVYVRSLIDIPASENDIEVVWRISEKNGKQQLLDLVVEGVSMMMSYRNEYTAVLQKNGGNIKDLIDKLETKIPDGKKQ